MLGRNSRADKTSEPKCLDKVRNGVAIRTELARWLAFDLTLIQQYSIPGNLTTISGRRIPRMPSGMVTASVTGHWNLVRLFEILHSGMSCPDRKSCVLLDSLGYCIMLIATKSSTEYVRISPKLSKD